MLPEHPIILLKSNKFNMAAVSVKRSIILEGGLMQKKGSPQDFYQISRGWHL